MLGEQAGGILIVGGGIGGLSAALAAARAGFEVRLLERSAQFGEIGAGIQLGPNATRLLRSWDLLDRITAAGVLPSRLVLRSAITGRQLSALDLGAGFRARYGAPYVVCHRGDLLAALLDACREDPRIALEANRLVVDVRAEAGHATVGCADGTSYRGAAVVGADGLRSLVRGFVCDDEPVCAGYASYRGAIPLTDATRPSALDEVVGWIGPGLHFVQYALHADDLYNQVAVFRSEEFAAGVAEWGSPEELERAFAVTCEPVREALRSIRRDARWYMFDRAPAERWTKGRVTLLGDAAHPMLQYLAQGACQALEDSGALGAALHAAAGGGDVPAALQDYERRRAARAARVQRAARLWGEIWHTSDPLALTLRDALLEARAADDYRFTDWLYEHEADAPAAAAGEAPAAVGARVRA